MHTELKYIDSFRHNIVKQVIEQGLEVAKVARKAGISKVLLNDWVEDTLQRKSNHRQQDQLATRAIQKENWELKRQNDLLKKVIEQAEGQYRDWPMVG